MLGVLTVVDAKDFVNETLVGELRQKRSQRIDHSIDDQEIVDLWGDLRLPAGQLPPHSHHQIDHLL